ncbi:MAG: hypothetical protein L3J24_15125 [Xanthomonadales bacterium]|nr:hypothetical protein [Xanthomonadales bacterium]
MSGSNKTDVIEEQIKQDAEVQFVENDAIEYIKTVTKNNRSEPPLSDLPGLRAPSVWTNTSANGMRVLGIEQNELPVVNFSLRIDGGQALDNKSKLGTAYLLAQLIRLKSRQYSCQHFQSQKKISSC